MPYDRDNQLLFNNIFFFKNNSNRSVLLSVFLCFMKMWEIKQYIKLCRESQDTHERRKTPAKCRGLGTLYMKKLIVSVDFCVKK